MKINEVRCYSNPKHRLINMSNGGIEFAYYNVDGHEVFEVYHLDSTKPSGYRYSRSWQLHEGKLPPKKYNAELEFLKEEFHKIDWETLEVTNALVKGY